MERIPKMQLTDHGSRLRIVFVVLVFLIITVVLQLCCRSWRRSAFFLLKMRRTISQTKQIAMLTVLARYNCDQVDREVRSHVTRR